MASIWRAIRSGRFKHEKLSEEEVPDGGQNGNPVSRFTQLQYLGCTAVEKPSSNAGHMNNAAINRIMAMTRRTGRWRRNRSADLTISGTAITVTVRDAVNSSSETNNEMKSTTPTTTTEEVIPLNRISYCFVDSNRERILAFVATNTNGCHECHAFMVATPKLARTIAMAVSGAFVQAYERWLQRQESMRAATAIDSSVPVSQQPAPLMIDLDLETETTAITTSQINAAVAANQDEWVNEWLTTDTENPSRI